MVSARGYHVILDFTTTVVEFHLRKRSSYVHSVRRPTHQGELRTTLKRTTNVDVKQVIRLYPEHERNCSSSLQTDTGAFHQYSRLDTAEEEGGVLPVQRFQRFVPK